MRRGTMRLAALVSAVLSLTAGGLIAAPVAAADPDGRTYFISNSDASCDDAGPATEAEPWCDLTETDGVVFEPGDAILLARGDTWDQELRVEGSGTASAHITVGAYGTGERPKIIRDGSLTARAMTMTNPSHWTVRDIEMGNAGAGLVVYYDTTAHEDLDFLDLYIHHMAGIHQDRLNTYGDDYVYDSAGIEFTGPVTLSPEDPTVITDVLIEDFEGAHNLDSIAFDWQGDSGITLTGGASSRDTMTNVRMRRIYLHDDDDGGIAAPYCAHSLRIANMSDVTLQDSVLTNLAACFVTAGTSEVIVLRANRVHFLNNMLVNTPETGSHDETAVDHEIDTDSIDYRGNYFADNAGAGLSLLNIHAPSATETHYDTNNSIIGNVFVNNALLTTKPVQLGGIRVAGNYGPTTGEIDGNLSFEPTGFMHTDANGTFDDFTIGDNREATSDDEVWYSAAQFTGVQGADGWRYVQTRDGGTSWTAMAASSDGSSFVGPGCATSSAFVTSTGAGSGAGTAREWTATREGVVSLRGTVLAAEDAVQNATLAISVNGAAVWTGALDASSDPLGVLAFVDDLDVSAGDVIRFEVISAQVSGASVSWVPAVAYTA